MDLVVIDCLGEEGEEGVEGEEDRRGQRDRKEKRKRTGGSAISNYCRQFGKEQTSVQAVRKNQGGRDTRGIQRGNHGRRKRRKKALRLSLIAL